MTDYLPEYVASVQEFQRIFSPYFPNIRDDWDRAAFEMEWLETKIFGNPIETVRRSDAFRDLARFKASLKQLGTISLPGASRAVFEHVILKEELFNKLESQPDGYRIVEESPAVSNAERRILEIVSVLAAMQEEDVLATAIESLCSRMERGINDLPETRNINWVAVLAVDGLRILWGRNTGKDGPKRALNPASRFSAFLDAGFGYLEIEADPISAFKRWAAIFRNVA